MAGKPWAPDDPRRALRAAQMRERMADPAERERKRQLLRLIRADPKHEATRRRKRYTKANRQAASERLKQLHADPVFVEAVRAGLKRANERPGRGRNSDTTAARAARLTRLRGGEIPQGYEARYRELKGKHEHRGNRMSASDALYFVELEKAQHDAVPAEYEDVYQYLLSALRVSPAEAKEIIRQQRALDLRH
jgi:hypothetical protein